MMRMISSQSAATTRALCVRVSFAACPKAPPLCTQEQRILHTACNAVDTTHSKLHSVQCTQWRQHTAHYPKLHTAQMALHIAHYEQRPVNTLYSWHSGQCTHWDLPILAMHTRQAHLILCGTKTKDGLRPTQRTDWLIMWAHRSVLCVGYCVTLNQNHCTAEVEWRWTEPPLCIIDTLYLIWVGNDIW